KCAKIVDSAKHHSKGSLHKVVQFCEEARTSLHIGAHSNIMSLRYVCEDNTHGAEEQRNQFLLFYDLAEGGNLQTYLLQRRAMWLNSSRSLEDVQQHLFSLAYQLIHGLGWLH